MKKETVKGYVVGAVSTLLIAGTVVPAAAQNIDVMGGVRIFVDDVQLSGAEGFIYNGTTYLPVRKISDAVGKAVTWDGRTKSVYIGKHESSEPAVMLADLDYFDKGNGGFSDTDSVKDNIGNIYYDVVGMSTYRVPWEEYKIDGKYTRLSGKATLRYEDRSDHVPCFLKIYGDGKLLYASPEIVGGTEPAEFDIDLTGVLRLRIEAASLYSTGGPRLYLVNTGLYQ